MSCVYGYLCRDCNESVDYGNHTDDLLRDIFKVEREANVLLDASEELPVFCVEFDNQRYGHDSIETCFRFLKKHRGHDLVIGNEYHHTAEYFVLTHQNQ